MSIAYTKSSVNVPVDITGLSTRDCTNEQKVYCYFADGIAMSGCCW